MKNKGHVAVIVLGYLTVLTVLAYLAVYICTWILERQETAAGTESGILGAQESESVPAAAEVGLVLKDGEMVMTQEELDRLLLDAQELAMQEARLQDDEALVAASANARSEVLDGIRAQLETGELTMVEVLRPYYPDHIVVVSSGKFFFVPIDRELKLNSYETEKLNILESGELQYMEEGEVVSHKGIDVSKFQGKINWSQVASDGVEFAFIRVANRGYGSAGKLVEDATFDANMSGALAAGIHPGVYIYSQAINEKEVLEEAELVLKKLAPYDVKCPIVFDVEKTADKNGRMNQLTLEERTNLTLLFCQTIENAGYKPMLYHNMEMAALMIDIATFENYDKWFAYYNQDMYYPYEYKIWQYSDKGRVSGINGNVDLNISFSRFWEE